MPSEVEALTGAKEIRAKLSLIVRNAPKELGAALYAEALLIEQESRRRTPVLTGALRASHETSLPLVTRDEVAIAIRCGGPAAPYAIYVHEMVELHHRVGQAKFLESAVLEASAGLAERVARRVSLERMTR